MFVATNQILDRNYPGGGSVTATGLSLTWNTASNGAVANGIPPSVMLLIIKQRLEFINSKPGPQNALYTATIALLQQSVDTLTTIEQGLP